jgi:GNAT superfamily N-acetyltransferase
VIRVRGMTEGDVPLGMELKRHAGWNQTEADWQRLLALEPDGCFVAELDGTPSATLTTCVFGAVAWIAMVLVRPQVRGRGLAKALLAHALEYLDRRGVRSIRLDATPMGEPLYTRLGFVVQYPLCRYEGVLPPARGQLVPFVEPAQPGHYGELVRRDQEVTRTDRGKLLLRLFTERPGAVRVVRRSGQVAGFLTERPGTEALQIGPCVATADAGPLLLLDAFERHAGQRVYLDVPAPNGRALTLAAERGLTMQRQLVRMVRGTPLEENTAELWASSGPEKG